MINLVATTVTRNARNKLKFNILEDGVSYKSLIIYELPDGEIIQRKMTWKVLSMIFSIRLDTLSITAEGVFKAIYYNISSISTDEINLSVNLKS